LIIADKAVTIETPKKPTPIPEPQAPPPTPAPEVVSPTSQLWTEPGTGMEFVWVEKGCFNMGSPEDEIGQGDDEGPVHEVCLDGFWIGKYEVTQAQWQQVMGKNPSFFNEDKLGRTALDHPVERMSWNDVQEFLQKLNEQAGEKRYRLPSEAEWEYAARAGTETMYFFGNDIDQLKEYAWYSKNSDSKTHPVGQRKPNAWGLYDMHGNVWEWCQDWYGSDYYSKSPSKNPQGPSSGKARVLRGGAWDNDPENCRSADRSWRAPNGWYIDFGFRVVAD
jgi:formylglycine-generating enzyme required for sulfatase activity